MATFQPSDPESLDDLTLCPQKELTRRVRLTPRIRAPATAQAQSEKDSTEEEEEDTDDGVSFQPYLKTPRFLEQELQTPGPPEAAAQVEGSPAWDSSGGSCASTEGSSPWDEAGSSGYLAKKGLSRDRCEEPLPLPEFSKDSGSLEELSQDDLFSWTNWGSSSPGPTLALGEPLVSLQTLTFWDSSPEEEVEEEEEEQGRESETEDSDAGSYRADSLQRPEAKSRMLGCYMAR